MTKPRSISKWRQVKPKRKSVPSSKVRTWLDDNVTIVQSPAIDKTKDYIFADILAHNLLSASSKDKHGHRLCSDCRWKILGRCKRHRKHTGEMPDDYGENIELERHNGWFMALLMGECGARGRYFEPKQEV